MVRSLLIEARRTEELLAELTEAAYRAALRHGLKGSFVEAEMDIWKALRGVLQPQREEEACVR